MRTVTPRALSMLLAGLSLCALGCRNQLEPTDDGHSALFVAEGDDLLDQLDSDGAWGTSPLLAVRPGSSRVGLRYDATGPVAAEVRVSTDDGATFTGWQAAELTFHEDRANNARVDLDVEGATHAQVRFMSPVESGLSFLAVDAFVPADEQEVSTSVVTQGLAADGVALPRSAWGARTRNCNSASPPTRITVHHTETPTNDSMSVTARLRQIQNYHIDVRGWCDIGYHFLVGSDGNVYQGRRENTLGAHVANANSGNVGVSFVGSFMTSAPSAIMQDAAARIIGVVARTYGISINRTNIKGHRERGSTDCPGDALFNRLGALVTAAANNGPAAPSPGTPATPPPGCAEVRVVGASTLNVRRDPNTSRAPVSTLSEDDVVPVVSSTNGQSILGVSTWYRITDGSVTGYISGAYAHCESDAPSAPSDPSAPSTLDAIYGGLDRGTARIPRSGLSNDTLDGALGVSVEPFGTLSAYEGRDFVAGRVSWFGGPQDSGVTSTETGAITGERLRSLNDPVNASDATVAARPEDFYFVAMRWDYTPHGRAFWEDARVLVVNPANGKKVVLRPVDWGPNTSTDRILDVSPQAMEDLGATTDDELLVSFAAQGAALGGH